ncbi:MAG: hypothetical protein ABSG81_01715 [Acidimicrobiales bacterium]
MREQLPGPTPVIGAAPRGRGNGGGMKTGMVGREAMRADVAKRRTAAVSA